MGQKQKTEKKKREKERPKVGKNNQTIIIFCIYLLVMPKYWGKQIFILVSFPEVGQKQKMEKKKKREKERLNDGNNNGQAIL